MSDDRPKRPGQKQREVVFRGTLIGVREQQRIRRFVAARPRATRDELARGVCGLFGWRRPNGELPVRGCTQLLARLERAGILHLPAARRGPRRGRPRRDIALSAAVELIADGAWEQAVDSGASLVVRPVVEAERLGWRAYMERFHYLGDCRLVGESLRYVAMLGEALVALLGWSAATLCNGPRDRYIGWDKAAKARGLHKVVNNARFLMLPWVRQPNLASRILGANLRRLSPDWQAVYGHQVLLAETFVDTSRFAGTCYRASNWRYLGETKGFARRGPDYSFHGQSKAVFVFPLHRRAIRLLCTAPCASAARAVEEVDVRTLQLEEMPLDGDGGLFAVLGTITDPRKRRGVRYSLQSLLAFAVCATLAGAKSFGAIYEWGADQTEAFRRRLRSRCGRAPSERTLRRVLLSVDAQEVDTKVGQWLAGLHGTLEGSVLALDGKSLRGSRDGEDNGAVHLLAAVVHGSGEVLAQTRVDKKTNEITRVAPLLSDLDVAGAVVTGDALLTQREIARHLVEDRQADYVFTVKDNQPTLRREIMELFASEEEDARRLHRARQKPPETEAFPP